MFQWSDEYAVGVPKIDAQHQELFRTAQEVHKALLKGHGQDVMVRVFVRLVAYTHKHFTAEEELMEALHYPEIDHHKAMHEEFRAKVKQFCGELSSGRAPLTSQVLKFLETWLSQHICQADRRLGIYMRAKSQLDPSRAR